MADNVNNPQSNPQSRRLYAMRQTPSSEYTRVEAERMEAELGDGFGQSMPGMPLPKPPRLATWILLVLAWMFLGSSAPFTVFIGLPLDIAALVLAIVCLTRGGLFTGLAVLFLGTAGSLFVYLVGLFMFLGKAAGA